MTKDELKQAMDIARSDRDLSNIDIEHLVGYALPDFGPVTVAVEAAMYSFSNLEPTAMQTTFNIGDAVRFRRHSNICTQLGTVRDQEKSSTGNYILVEVSLADKDGQKLWWIHESNVFPPLWKISPEIRGLSQNCGY